MDQQNDGDTIDGSVGDNGKDIAVGKDITQAHQEATGNVVNIFQPALPAPRRRRSPAAPRSELMADAAQEIWKVIAEMNALLGRQENALETNTRATEKHAEAIAHLGRVIEEDGRLRDAQHKAMTDQVAALEVIARALRGTGIQVPDTDHPQTTRQMPWWHPLLTPILLTLIFLVLFWYLGLGGHLP